MKSLWNYQKKEKKPLNWLKYKPNKPYIILVMMFCMALFLVNFISATDIILTNYTGGSDSSVQLYNARLGAGQRFQVQVNTNSINVSMKLYRVGNPEFGNISIYGTNGSGSPNYTDLKTNLLFNFSTVSTDTGGVWYNFSLPQVVLYSNTNYSLQISSLLGTVSNRVNWLLNSTSGSAYPYGEFWDSSPPDYPIPFVDRDALFIIYGLQVFETQTSVNLISPPNGIVLSTSSYNFTSSFNMISGNPTNYGWNNATFYLWYLNGTQKATNFTTLSGNNTQANISFSNLEINNYKWNAYGCYSNATFNNCTWALTNNTFQVGAQLISTDYSASVYETSRQTITANFSILSGSEISVAQLIYNNATYSISNIVTTNSTLFISKTFDIPLNNNPNANQTNNFTFKFTYGGGVIQETETFQQNSSFINLVNCSGTYTVQALNFTLRDEKTLVNITPSINPTSMQGFFKYWIGGGSVYKNFSYELLNSSTVGNYRFCIYPFIPENYTFKADLDSIFSATDYSENEYYLRNATLTNQSTDYDLLLFLLDSASSTKFYVTIKQGITFVPDALVNVAKFFVGEGVYKTVSIKLTDGDGKFPFYADLDGKYLWSITKNGQVLGVIEKVASCGTAPCSMEINLAEGTGSIFSPINDIYAENVYSNLSFNPATYMVTYTFIDVTGLAHYFRLDVNKISFNGTVGETICNTQSFSSAGTLTCNVTGYSGDFFANGYISRSPEKIDKVLSFFISDALSQLGLMGILLNVIIIVTVVFVFAAMSKGNPAVITFMVGVTILLLKIGQLFPFSWVVVVSLEVGIAFLLMKLKS